MTLTLSFSISKNVLVDTTNLLLFIISLLPLLSIGQCFELIGNAAGSIPEVKDIKLGLCQVFVPGLSEEITAIEPIDALWEAVKSIL